nr:MAG TPA: hypothetical protein [Bacteriophage sp.]
MAATPVTATPAPAIGIVRFLVMDDPTLVNAEPSAPSLVVADAESSLNARRS